MSTRYLPKGVALIAALMTSNAAGAGPVPKSEAAFQALWAWDYLQTRQIAKTPERWRETNALLGPHPGLGAVSAYFAAGALLHYGIAYELASQDVPRPIQMAWQYVTIGIEAGYVGHNLSLGIHGRF